MSWFRKKGGKLDVLTVGRSTFSADDRYVVRRQADNWRLRVRPTLKRDNGTYVCQVSTHPPVLLLTHLRVIVPHVRLLEDGNGNGKGEKHYKPGSTIELHCVVRNYLEEFGPVSWRHGNNGLITQTSERGGVRYVRKKRGLLCRNEIRNKMIKKKVGST